jgi:methylglutaconyl-CoA hydratase
LTYVVTQDRLDAAVAAEVEPYLICAPGAVAAAKSLVRALGPKIDSQTIEMTISALVTQWEGDEAGQGIAAFFAKSPPPWAI